VRATDTIARLGGDEFGVLLEGCTLEQATRIADNARQAIRDFRFVWGTSTLSVGASIGIVQIRADTENVANIMSAADIACYAAKDAGRNRIHVYEADGVSDRHREMHWVARVTRAAENNRLELFFQPIVSLRNLDGRGFHELTVRLRDDDGELVPPSQFIPIAEESGMIQALGARVLRDACRQVVQWHREGVMMRLSVNLSVQQLQHDSCLTIVEEALRASGLAPQYLDLEITESVLMAETTIEAIDALRAE